MSVYAVFAQDEIHTPSSGAEECGGVMEGGSALPCSAGGKPMVLRDGDRAVAVHKYARGDAAQFESTSSEQHVVLKEPGALLPWYCRRAAAALAPHPGCGDPPDSLTSQEKNFSLTFGFTSQGFDVCFGLAATFYEQKLILPAETHGAAYLSTNPKSWHSRALNALSVRHESHRKERLESSRACTVPLPLLQQKTTEKVADAFQP